MIHFPKNYASVTCKLCTLMISQVPVLLLLTNTKTHQTYQFICFSTKLSASWHSKQY